MYTINEENKKLVDDINTKSLVKGAPKIVSEHKQEVIDVIIENQIKASKVALTEQSSAATTVAGGVSNWDPVLISMVRRGMPNLMAFDIAGVQPMTGPTGLVFALRPRYDTQSGTEAFYNEADTSHSGQGTHAGDTSGFQAGGLGSGDPATSTSAGRPLTLAAGELLGSTGGSAYNEMSFTIEQTQANAKTRALKAQYSTELAHDMRQMHNLDAESELTNILAMEIQAEIDREILRTVNISSQLGMSGPTGVGASNAGIFDMVNDADGRWLQERYKALAVQIMFEANQVAKTSRRGKANRLICSSNVADALASVGMLNDNPKYMAMLQVDDTGNTFAGMLGSGIAVYVDPYATVEYCNLVYKGTSSWDSGWYYCPYVGLELMKAVGEDNFQPRIGFKTRYDFIANPFWARNDAGTGLRSGAGLGSQENGYGRKFRVDNILNH